MSYHYGSLILILNLSENDPSRWDIFVARRSRPARAVSRPWTTSSQALPRSDDRGVEQYARITTCHHDGRRVARLRMRVADEDVLGSGKGEGSGHHQGNTT